MEQSTPNLYKFLVFLVILCFTIVPVLAQEEQSWCGITTLYFQHNNATIPVGYEQLINRPSGNMEVDENVTIVNTNGWVLIDTYITPEHALDFTKADLEGLRIYTFYSYVSSSVGTTKLNFTPWIYRNGALYQKFYSAESDDINALSVDEYTITHVSNSSVYFQPGDRIAIQVWARTDHSSPINVHFVYQGATHTSHVESGYLVCVSEMVAKEPVVPKIIYGMLGGLIVVAIYIVRLRK